MLKVAESTGRVDKFKTACSWFCLPCLDYECEYNTAAESYCV